MIRSSTDVVEEMLARESVSTKKDTLRMTNDLILLCKEGCTDAVDWSVSPSLYNVQSSVKKKFNIGQEDSNNLVIKTALLIKEIEEFLICPAAPEVQISDFKITPNWVVDNG